MPIEFTPKEAIKKVGRGRTLSQDLSFDEALSAFQHLLRGDFTAAQAGAFLQALRIKELTQEELNALVDAVYAVLADSTSVSQGISPELTLNLASDTARKGGLLCLLAARVLALQGHVVGMVRSAPVMTGNQASFEKTWAVKPHSRQSPLREVLASLDDLLSGWGALAGLRAELGFRSCLHTVEKMVQPWAGIPMVLGISHKHYAERMALAFQRRGQEAFIVLGNHGTADLALHKPTEVMVARADGITLQAVPHDLGGLAPDPGIYSLARFPEWEGLAMQGLSPGFRDALTLQTACLAWCMGLAETTGAALPKAIPWVHAWEETLR